MRLHYYRFPANTPEKILLKEGCAVRLKTGTVIYVESIPADKRDLVDYVEDTLSGVTVTTVKKLMKQYGGTGWTAHIDRDGSIFETTEITLTGNNSKYKYNKHL